MSRIIKLTYETADARERYAKIHQAIFRLSLRGIVDALARRNQVDYEASYKELSGIARSLDGIEKQLSLIDDSEISRVRGGGLIQLALLEYVQALGCSVRMLKGICTYYMRHREQGGGEEELVSAKAAYDDAVQYHRSLGDHLNQLLSTF